MSNLLRSLSILLALSLAACSSDNKSENKQVPLSNEAKLEGKTEPAPEKIVTVEDKKSWVDIKLEEIEVALDMNPIAAAQALPGIQQDIRYQTGFDLQCDDSFFGGYESYEIIKCYTAIKQLLIAIRNGLDVPKNPDDGFAIQEIIIVKNQSTVYEPIKGRLGLKVNHKMTAEEWPVFLNEQVTSFARENQVHRRNKIDPAIDTIIETLGLDDIDVDDELTYSEYEKGIRLLEQVIQLDTAGLLKDKAYEIIYLTDSNLALYEDKALLHVGINVNSRDTRSIYKYLVGQPNNEGRPLTEEQKNLIGAYNTTRQNNASLRAHETVITREKLQELRDDTQYLLFKGNVSITYSLEKKTTCNWWIFCKTTGLKVAQVYKFLLNLREAASGGDLSNMDIDEIRIARDGWNIKVYNYDRHIQFDWNATAKQIYKGLWYTTPAGKAYAQEQLDAITAAPVVY